MYFFKISQTFKCVDSHYLRQKTVTQSDKGLAKIAEGASPRRHAEISPVKVKNTHLMNNKLPPAQILCGEWSHMGWMCQILYWHPIVEYVLFTVSLSFCTRRCVIVFITHILCIYKRNWDGSCLVNLILFVTCIFQLCNLLHCVDEVWWNMPFKEMRNGDTWCPATSDSFNRCVGLM